MSNRGLDMSRATLDRSKGQTCAHMSKTALDMSKTALDTSNLVGAALMSETVAFALGELFTTSEELVAGLP